MKIYKKKIPRVFKVGIKNKIILKDVGNVYLRDNENLTFISGKNKKYEICKKNWGFYATSSVNKRLNKEGFKTALVKNWQNKFFVMIVDKNKKTSFKEYCNKEKYRIVQWLDTLK